MYVLLPPAEAVSVRVCIFVYTHLYTHSHTWGPSLQPGHSQPGPREHTDTAAGRHGRFVPGPGREGAAGAGPGRAGQLRGVPRARRGALAVPKGL